MAGSTVFGKATLGILSGSKARFGAGVSIPGSLMSTRSVVSVKSQKKAEPSSIKVKALKAVLSELKDTLKIPESINTTGYAAFLSDMKRSGEGAGLSFGEFSAKAKALWGSKSAEEKAALSKKYTEARAGYLASLDARGLGRLALYRKWSHQLGSKERVPVAPTSSRPATPYIRFIQDEYGTVSASLSPTDKMKALAEMWKAAPDSIKLQYARQAQDDKAAYKSSPVLEEVEAWKGRLSDIIYELKDEERDKVGFEKAEKAEKARVKAKADKAKVKAEAEKVKAKAKAAAEKAKVKAKIAKAGAKKAKVVKAAKKPLVRKRVVKAKAGE